MSQVVDHLAEITGYRDRDMLDVALVAALRDTLRPDSVAIYRCVGDPGAQRWLTRARQRLDEPAASADPLWSDLDSLPTLDSYPLRAECLRAGRVQHLRGGVETALFPLSGSHEVLGVLEIESAIELTPDERRLVTGILRVFRNFQGLLDYSERDTLTGLLNRKTFDDSFLRSGAATPNVDDEPIAGQRRAPLSVRVWLGVIDIDHFKLVNDNFGHLIGDEVLLLLSRLMRSCFRLHDQLYRFGGEEFVVLLRAANEVDAGRAFERMRATVEGYAFPQVGRITVSLGFTEVRVGDTPVGAFARADKAVYHAKQSGRNRVADHGALVASGVFAESQHASNVELF